MAKCDTILPLIAAMKMRPDSIGMAAEAMHKMFDLNIPELVVQVCTISCVQYIAFDFFVLTRACVRAHTHTLT